MQIQNMEFSRLKFAYFFSSYLYLYIIKIILNILQNQAIAYFSFPKWYAWFILNVSFPVKSTEKEKEERWCDLEWWHQTKL